MTAATTALGMERYWKTISAFFRTVFWHVNGRHWKQFLNGAHNWVEMLGSCFAVCGWAFFSTTLLKLDRLTFQGARRFRVWPSYHHVISRHVWCTGMQSVPVRCLPQLLRWEVSRKVQTFWPIREINCVQMFIRSSGSHSDRLVRHTSDRWPFPFKRGSGMAIRNWFL